MVSDALRIAGGIALVMSIALAMVVVAEYHPETEELLASHHLRRAYMAEKTAEKADDERLSELSRLAAAADEQAHSASDLKEQVPILVASPRDAVCGSDIAHDATQEASKLRTSPSSKVDAETMLANEASKKSAELFGKVTSDVCSLSRHFALFAAEAHSPDRVLTERGYRCRRSPTT